MFNNCSAIQTDDYATRVHQLSRISFHLSRHNIAPVEKHTISAQDEYEKDYNSYERSVISSKYE